MFALEDGLLVRVQNLVTAEEVCRMQLPLEATGLDFRRALSGKTGTSSLLYEILIKSEVATDADPLRRFLADSATEHELTIQVALKDKEAFLKGIRELRQALTEFPHTQFEVPDTHTLLDAAVPMCVRHLAEDDFPELQLESCWILATIVSGSDDNVEAVVNAGAIPLLVQLLGRDAHSEIVDQSLMALSNIAADSAVFREQVQEAGAIQQLVGQVEGGSEMLTSNLAWCLSNICNGAPYALAHVQPLVKILAKCLDMARQNANPDVLDYMLQVTRNLCAFRVHLVVDAGVVPIVIGLLSTQLSTRGLMFALQILAHVSASSDTLAVFDDGFLAHVPDLTRHQKTAVQRDVWCIPSNMMAGPLDQVRRVFSSRPGLIPELLQRTDSDDSIVARQALCALVKLFANIRTGNDRAMFTSLMGVGGLDALLQPLRDRPPIDARFLECVMKELLETTKFLRHESDVAKTLDPAASEWSMEAMQTIRECMMDVDESDSRLWQLKEEIMPLVGDSASESD
eukprot:TRINITY_DN21925_c0_g1_i1.p1 TRINITY_DN21925_c0_g1~~TRINITY_DN21925_c0_g1_i1.p1  ORF type:complete len:514 (+),score=50.96 TRINITY_DN21925_c0_g1_i1:60-1601(+)